VKKRRNHGQFVQTGVGAAIDFCCDLGGAVRRNSFGGMPPLLVYLGWEFSAALLSLVSHRASMCPEGTASQRH